MLPELLVLNPTAARPSNVPWNAEWYFESNEWVLCNRDAQSELHGSLRAYRSDGTPSLEFEYSHGKRHGPFRRFHASGQLAQVGRYFDDLPDGLLCVFSEGGSPYTIRECCIPAAARVMKQEHRRGQLLAESFYDAEGKLLVDTAGGPGAHGWPQPLAERETEVTRVEYGFWPAAEPLPRLASDVAVRVEQPLALMRVAIQRAAQRLLRFRAELIELRAPCVPPDVSALLGQEALPLRCFSYTAEGDDTSRVLVDETLPVGHDAVALAARARLEWTLLCWLCWATGSKQLELPERLLPRPELYAALLLASERQAALSGHDLRPDERAHFHGLDESRLPASALEHLAEHYREMRAALLFASDPDCQSPWQDDLGRSPARSVLPLV